MPKCNYCECELIFIDTVNGGKMPCEAGLVEIWRTVKGKQKAVTEQGDVVACEYEPVPFIGSEMAYIPHWANCPGAGTARRKKPIL